MRKAIRDDIENLLKSDTTLAGIIQDWGIEDKPAKYPALLVFPPSGRNKITVSFPNTYRWEYNGVIRVVIEAYNDRISGIETADTIDSRVEDLFKNNPTLGGKYFAVIYNGSNIVFGEYGTDYWGEGLVILDINYTVQTLIGG